MTAIGDAVSGGAAMQVGAFIKEDYNYGVIIACGKVAYDVIWVGGSTTRYAHSARRIKVVDPDEIDEHTRAHLVREAVDARAERARGAGIRRGTVSPHR